MVKNITDSHVINTDNHEASSRSEDELLVKKIAKRKTKTAKYPDNHIEVTLLNDFYHFYGKSISEKPGFSVTEKDVKHHNDKKISADDLLKKSSEHAQLKNNHLINEANSKERLSSAATAMSQSLIENNEKTNDILTHHQKNIREDQWAEGERLTQHLAINVDITESRLQQNKSDGEKNKTSQSHLHFAQRQAEMNNAHQIGSKQGESTSVSINYQFQQWAGDHSVKVSIPTELRREGGVTLLPSDIRAAEMLAKQINQLSIFSPQLLHPERDTEQEGHHRQRYQQSDNQEEDIE